MSTKKSNVESLVSAEHDLADDYENVKEKASETIDAISETAAHVKGNAKKIAKDSWDNIQEQSKETQDSILNFINEYPLATVGAAFLTGVLFSRIFGKK